MTAMYEDEMKDRIIWDRVSSDPNNNDKDRFTMTELAALRKGKHVRSVARDAEVPFVAHSFAGIYLLVLVFAAPFDELRAERAVVEWLPRIERLVLALPPLDPAPKDGGGVVAIRRSRRR